MKRFEKMVKVDGKDVEVKLVEREKRGNTRVHVFVEEGSESVLDDLMNRRSRPVDQWRVLATRVMRELGFNPQEAYMKLRWSQKAGCSCGCSPGFVMADYVVRGLPGVEDLYSTYGFDVFVTPQPSAEVVAARAAAKLEQFRAAVPENVVLSEN